MEKFFFQRLCIQTVGVSVKIITADSILALWMFGIRGREGDVEEGVLDVRQIHPTLTSSPNMSLRV